MVALAPERYVAVWHDGQSERTALYALRNVDAGDTADVAQLFSVVKRAVILGTTLAGAGVVSTIAGTVVTLPAGPTDDAGYLLVYGCAA